MARELVLPNRVCANPECGAFIVSYRKEKKYCNRACHAATRRRPKKTCPGCGERFRPSLRGRRGQQQVHCSHACAKRAWWEGQAATPEWVEKGRANLRERANKKVLGRVKHLLAKLPPEHNVKSVREVVIEAVKWARWTGYQRAWLQKARAERKGAA